ncbi:hypothetical protein GGI15_001009 [Coemansia interrupta]|uniref:Uncharacterized protein n=1 Tax=Coemansia interrupta TaxID=1126814 RepID=A0A9W8HNK3_9FUNG|nr:hypothetical protein GGI15_001009 [Coemansia interrupta]
MRPDPYKKKASRIYWSKHKDELAALKAADKDKPQPTEQDIAETPPPLQPDQSDDTPQTHSRGQYSRRKLEDNSWRYVEETEVDEEAMINARIEAAQDEKDMREIVGHLKAQKLDTTAHKDNVYVRAREELDPVDAEERARMLEEMNKVIVYDEFNPDPRAVSAVPLAQDKGSAVRINCEKLSVSDLAPNLVLPGMATASAQSAEPASSEDIDELDALLDELL